MPDLEATIRSEQCILRSELQELKKCQLQYFLLSIGATGAVFGFSEGSHFEALNSLIHLTPLLIILPCWLTFFDKANTITRLTGYIRVFIEDQLILNCPTYLGYENALDRFRTAEKKHKFPKMHFELSTIIYPTRHQYWKINWLTFLCLSFACCLYPYFTYFKNLHFTFSDHRFVFTVYGAFVVATIVSTIFSLRILCRLLFGRYSYENVKTFWDKVYADVI
jgi:hypothetical protein